MGCKGRSAAGHPNRYMGNMDTEKEEQLKEKFPITGLVPGWFFKVEELSNCVFLAEGTDLFGRVVSHNGTDPDLLLDKCQNDAKRILAEMHEPKC